MFAAMLHPTVYIAAGLGLGAVLLMISYWQQSRQVKRQMADLQKARNDLKSINASNIGLGRRIKSLESRGPVGLSSVGLSPAGLSSVAQSSDSRPYTAAVDFNQNVQSIEPSLESIATAITADSSVPEDLVEVSSTSATLASSEYNSTEPAAVDANALDTTVAKDLRELQAHQQSLLQSLNQLERQSDTESLNRASSFQDNLANQLERAAVSEQYFVEPVDAAIPSSNVTASATDSFDPYSYDDEPEPDLEQTPYTRASAMLDEGLSLDEIERQSCLSKAEIKLMATMHKNMSNFALA